MRSFRDISIGSKLTFVIMATSSIALLLACLAVGAYDLLDLKRTMASDLQTIAGIVGENSTAALTFNDADAARGVLAALRSESHIESACIFSRDGKQFASYARLASDRPPAFRRALTAATSLPTVCFNSAASPWRESIWVWCSSSLT